MRESCQRLAAAAWSQRAGEGVPALAILDPVAGLLFGIQSLQLTFATIEDPDGNQLLLVERPA
jgi:hypothetical protein